MQIRLALANSVTYKVTTCMYCIKTMKVARLHRIGSHCLTAISDDTEVCGLSKEYVTVRICKKGPSLYN